MKFIIKRFTSLSKGAVGDGKFELSYWNYRIRSFELFLNNIKY